MYHTMLLVLMLMVLSLAHGRYHFTDELLNEVKTQCHGPLKCRVEDNRLVVDWKTNSDKRVLLLFNEHARERVTGELALEVIRHLHEWNPQISVTIIPVFNAWGRRQVEQGNPCLRKNENGVDPNRNYQMPSNYHHYAHFSEEYEGPTPLSESGSRMIVRELKSVSRYINVHSGEFSLYMPYDSTTSRRPPEYQAMRKKLNDWYQKCPRCSVGSAASTSLYKAYGTSVDWAVDHGVPEAYTFEIYGKETADCDKMFNPPQEHLEDIINMWLPIIHDGLQP